MIDMVTIEHQRIWDSIKNTFRKPPDSICDVKLQVSFTSSSENDEIFKKKSNKKIPSPGVRMVTAPNMPGTRRLHWVEENPVVCTSFLEMLQNGDARAHGSPSEKVPAWNGSLRWGNVSVCAETRGGIGAPRRAGRRVAANGTNIAHYLTAKRDNFDGCPTCAGGERRTAGHERLRASNCGPAGPESSSQLQSASLCFFYTPIKNSHTQTTPSCIKHVPAGPSSSCLL